MSKHKRDHGYTEMVKKHFAWLLEKQFAKQPEQRIVVLIDMTGAGLSNVVGEFVLLIIFYFINVAFFLDYLGSDVCPRVDNQTSGDTLQNLTRPLVEKLPSASYPPVGINWSECLVAGCPFTPTCSHQGRDTGI